MKWDINKILKIIVLFILVAIPIFQHLADRPIELWDESRLSVNALNMILNKNYIVTFFDGLPDMWNTKPPFLIWMQAISMQIFGWNEGALRLPTAFAGFITCLAILIFIVKKTKQYWLGAIAVVVLVTTEGFIISHTTRSGNYDAMLTMFLCLQALFFYLLIETNKTKYYYLFFIILTLALLTKSIAGLFFLPAFLIFTIWQKKIIAILKNKHFYFGIIIFLFFGIGYYILREHYNNGYINAVLENEIFGRYLKVNEGHAGDFWFYYNLIINNQLYVLWFICLPIGIVLGCFSVNKTIAKFSIFCSLIVVSFFIIISSAKSYLEWYTMPLYPFVAILVAIAIYYFFISLKHLKPILITKNIFPYLFLFILFFKPYQNIFSKTNTPNLYLENNDRNKLLLAVHYAFKHNVNMNNINIIMEDNALTDCMFYKIIWKEKFGQNVFLKSKTDIKENDFVLITQQVSKDYLETKFTLVNINSLQGINIYKAIKK